jgi:hypothetical protein
MAARTRAAFPHESASAMTWLFPGSLHSPLYHELRHAYIREGEAESLLRHGQGRRPRRGSRVLARVYASPAMAARIVEIARRQPDMHVIVHRSGTGVTIRQAVIGLCVIAGVVYMLA